MAVQTQARFLVQTIHRQPRFDPPIPTIRRQLPSEIAALAQSVSTRLLILQSRVRPQRAVAPIVSRMLWWLPRLNRNARSHVDAVHPLHYGAAALAQSVERKTLDLAVADSSPAGGATGLERDSCFLRAPQPALRA